MLLKATLKKVVFCLLIVSLIFLFFKKEVIVLQKKDELKIQNFDIIITKGQSFLSKVLNLINLEINGFTHVGVIYKENQAIYVLHATPDGSNENGIRYDSISTFLNLSDVDKLQIIRIDKPNDISAIKNQFNHYKNAKHPFDFDFDNFESSKLYCSELLLKIFNSEINFDGVINKPIHPDFFTKIKKSKLILSINSD